ncbi:hypothetical protein ACFVH6_05730 [Spirillospora sp. NPDC127200]
MAAKEGSPQVLFEPASHADDIDTLCHGRSALWNAVHHRRDDNALVLLQLGADPWRPMMQACVAGLTAVEAAQRQMTERDLHPGYGPASDATAREVLAGFASCGGAIAHCLVYAGLRPSSTDCLESPDAWVRLSSVPSDRAARSC